MALDPLYGPMSSTVSTYGGLTADARTIDDPAYHDSWHASPRR